MKHLNEMTKNDIKKIKLLVFDVDGVLVKRGTKIKQTNNITTLETKKIAEKQIKQIKTLNKRGFYINISSGRGLYMLQEMFREILDSVSLTYENGSATWLNGKLCQHVNSFNQLKNISKKLKKIKHPDIKAFEPKEFIITIHCKNRIKQIENLMSKEKALYSIWNSEAYDIGVKALQTKARGLNKLAKLLKLKKENILVIGDNYNDKELMSSAGLAISADKSRLKGDFYVELEGKKLPADILMDKLLLL